MSNRETHAAAKLQLLLLFCLLVFSYNSFSQSKTAAFKNTSVDSGKVFQFITLKDIDGKTIKADDLAGKTVVFNFWFIGCPPCRYEIPMLSEIAEKYKDRNDIVFIAVSNDKTADIKAFLKRSVFKYRLIGNGKNKFANYGVDTCPLSLIVNKAGIITFNSSGYRVAEVSYKIEEYLTQLK